MACGFVLGSGRYVWVDWGAGTESFCAFGKRLSGLWEEEVMDVYRIMAIEALERMRGDDLYLAEQRFGRMTPEGLARPYGESSQTCGQVLDSYRAREKHINAAIEWVRNVGSMHTLTHSVSSSVPHDNSALKPQQPPQQQALKYERGHA